MVTKEISLDQCLSRHARAYKDKVAIYDLKDNTSLSYEELYSLARRLSAYFQGRGIKTAIMILPGGKLNAALWLSCLISGMRLIPLSPETSPLELKATVKEFKPDIILDEARIHKIISDLKENVVAQPRSAEQKSSVILFTSGSTGEPKRIELTAKALILTANNIVIAHELTDTDSCLTPLPFYHVNAPVVSLLSSILSGGQVIIAAKYSTSNFWNWVKQTQPTWISLVPTMLAMLLGTNKPKWLSEYNIRFIRTASAPLPVAIMKKFELKFGLEVIETYGISEAGSTIFANPLPPKVHKAGSVGLAVGVRARICSLHSIKPLLADEVGEVLVSGPNVIKSYMYGRDPEAFASGWFRTGDLGYMDKDGYLFLTGRIKDIIIRGGENIFPREIEEIILSDSGVREVAVVGMEDKIYGEKPIAFMVIADIGQKKLVETRIKHLLTSSLIPQKRPERYIFLDQLPKTRTNKINKPELRSMSV